MSDEETTKRGEHERNMNHQREQYMLHMSDEISSSDNEFDKYDDYNDYNCEKHNFTIWKIISVLFKIFP